MRRMFAAAVLMIALALAACTDRAQELYQTAQFEEQQYNREHAASLYRQIIESYPDSPYAAQASARLAELEPK